MSVFPRVLVALLLGCDPPSTAGPSAADLGTGDLGAVDAAAVDQGDLGGGGARPEDAGGEDAAVEGPECPVASDRCPAACAWLADCGIQLCAGYDEAARPALLELCGATCARLPGFADRLCDQSTCGAAVALVRVGVPAFRAECDGSAGAGGAGGAGGGEAPRVQLDRVGRPGVALLLVPAGQRETYNRDADPNGWPARWGEVLASGLTAADGLGGDMPFLPPEALGPFLAEDFLVVDAGQPYAADGYFGVELALVGAMPQSTSGGRSLTQNVMDGTFSAWVGTPLDTVWDCVEGNDRPFSNDFPYLAPPHE